MKFLLAYLLPLLFLLLSFERSNASSLNSTQNQANNAFQEIEGPGFKNTNNPNSVNPAISNTQFFDIILRMFTASSTVRKIIGTCFLTALFVSFVSMYLHVRGIGNMDMPMPGCPFMNESAVLCTMDPIQHLTAWQHMFTATPVVEAMLLLSLIIALALARTELLS